MTNKKNMPLSYDLGKLPPQSIEFEESVLGAAMLEKDAIEEIVNILHPESFYKSEHAQIFTSIINLYKKNKPIDIITVIQNLRECKRLEDVGGPLYLTQLTSRIASAAHIEYHARVIQQNFMRRELIRISTSIQNKSYDDSIDVKELIDSAQEEINNISSNNIKKSAVFIGDVGKDRLKKLEEISKSETKTTGVNSFDKINKLTGGWQNGNLIILAARPSMGKTKIAQEFAKKAVENGDSILFFSLEMADTELYDRELSSITGIENMIIRKAEFRDEDWMRIEDAQHRIELQKILIDDTPALKLNDFRAKARLYKKKYDIKMIVIDYLQLMRSPEHAGFREREVAEISSGLKAVAKELDIPIIALSQLGRQVETRPDKRPMLSDLRESGSIEQDADIVMFIYRPEHYHVEIDENGNSTKNLIQLIFAKQRGGATGTIDLWKTTRWTEISDYSASESENENPF